ncbi:CoA ester lyase [Pseudonocardia ailaonensis]|uniref:CoA ester lyase n=1 Tax=Pseudonocardia ailaonensis TaxID=367279 RepID=A0ABN2NF85_9PSEU
MLAPRSYLYVPGDRPDRMATAAGRGADALVLDLEDAVAVHAKGSARRAVAEFLATAPDGPELWVRVNADLLDEDVAAVAMAACTGILLPKAEPELLLEAHEALCRAELARDLVPGTFGVVPLVETPRGIVDVVRLAEGPRVRRMGIGEADLAAALGLRPGPDRAELAPHRAMLVVASAAAGRPAPIAPVETDLTLDDATLAERTRALLREGFRARTAIHPRQVPVLNAVFTPTAEEVAEARDVVDRLAGTGSGVGLDRRGRLIDEAIARSARDVLARQRR